MPEDIELLKELEKCAKCGQCRSVCPIFLALKDEKLVTRGRLAIIQAQFIGRQIRAVNPGEAYPQLDKIIDTCLMCQRCETNCPSLVKTSAVFRAERQRIARERGLPFLLSFGFRWILPYRRLYDVALKSLYLYQSKFGWGMSAPGRHLAFLKHIPKLAAKAALKSSVSYASDVRGQAFEHKTQSAQHTTHDAQRVAIFIGCAANYIYPGIVDKLMRILKQYDIPFFIPAGQVCCGFPALLAGDEPTSKRLEQKNLLALARANTILTVCPTCNKMLKENYASRGSKLVNVIDAFDFVAQISKSQISENHSSSRLEGNLKSPIPMSTIYHQPCHTADTTSANIVNWLKANTEYRQVEENLCCGGGGLFSFKYPALSNEIGQARIKSLVSSDSEIPNPQWIVTNCPGCLMQLEYLLKVNNLADVKVKHAVELIPESGQSPN